MPPIISVENLSKKYTIRHQSGSGPGYRRLSEELASAIARPFRRRKTEVGGQRSAIGNPTSDLRHPTSDLRPPPSAPASESFWALRDISFDVQQGEVLGIIGRNGAGKSTLLKILSRITEPTKGRVTLRGRVASLLEVGTGFHSELTGRENVFLNGAILGMSRAEIRRRFDEIVAFAEVEKFLDTPVKHYSSGMYVRLAFAVAAHLEPEILIVDEVLAVGDSQFQKRCLGRMEKVAKDGRTVIFVSHNMSAVRQLTQQAVLLDAGKLIKLGASAEIVEVYISADNPETSGIYELRHVQRCFPELSRQVEFHRVRIVNPSAIVPADSPLEIEIDAFANATTPRLRFSMTVLSSDEVPVGNVFGLDDQSMEGGTAAKFQFKLDDHRLAPGIYHCSIAVGKGDNLKGFVDFDIVQNVLRFEVMPPRSREGMLGSWSSSWGRIRFDTPTVTKLV